MITGCADAEETESTNEFTASSNWQSYFGLSLLSDKRVMANRQTIIYIILQSIRASKQDEGYPFDDQEKGYNFFLKNNQRITREGIEIKRETDAAFNSRRVNDGLALSLTNNMINTYMEDDAWCYWVITVAAFFAFVAFLLACICSCRRHENKSEFLGLAGMVTITNHIESEGFDRPPMTEISQILTQDTVDGGKRASGANRSLPDIPKDKNVGRDGETESAPQDVIYEVTEPLGDPSDLYATVQDKNVDKNRDPERDVRSNSQGTSSIPDDSVYPYARLNTLESHNDEHPYAQLQSIQKAEHSQQNRNNVSQLSDVNQPSTSACQVLGSGNPVAPPRSRRSSSHNSLLSVETTCDIQAANAISGGVQANQDLPYMTPPILMPLPRPPSTQHNIPHQHFSGDSQDSKGYTSISVREPLANIIAQTKAAHHNRQGTRPLTDPHYATVSDDSDEMYAAIDEQDKVYTSGSETYAQIQPMVNEISRIMQTEQQAPSQIPSRSNVEDPNVPSAPQPPSVDSLRHVAHAHSRQASSSSATSSVANPGSPKPEKRQANSPLPPPPPPPPAPSEPGNEDVYASVEKRGKLEERGRSIVSSGKSLEDMYAKVMKKKRENEDTPSENHASTLHSAEVSTCEIPTNRKLSLVEISRASWSSHDSVEIQKRETEPYHAKSQNSVDAFNAEMDIEFSKIARTYQLDSSPEHLDDELDDHAYEPLANRTNNQQITKIKKSCDNDPNYEMLRPQYATTSVKSNASNWNPKNGIDVLAAYSLPFKPPQQQQQQQRQVSNASSEDPGYERVRLRRRIDHDQDTDSEPNYESMPHDSGEPNYASVCRPGDSDTDPNYESVIHGDPNYESVRYMSGSRTSEPPYERVNNYAQQHNSDRRDDHVGYEKVKCNQTTLDPNYERINLSQSEQLLQNDSGDTDDEQYVQV